MGRPKPIAIHHLALGLLLPLLAGCSFLQSFLPAGNPFVPKAENLMVTANPALIDARINCQRATNTFVTPTSDPLSFQVGFPNGSVHPGVTLTQYTLRYFDNAGLEIDRLVIPPQQLATYVYLPGSGSSGNAQGTSPQIPAVTDAVYQYGKDNGFVNEGTARAPQFQLNTNPWSQTITGQVVFSGTDDNHYPASATGSFTIRFVTALQ